MYKGRFSTDYIQHQAMAMRSRGILRTHVNEAENMVLDVAGRLIAAANKDDLDELPRQSITMSPQAMLVLMKLAGAGYSMYCASLPEDQPDSEDALAEAERLSIKMEAEGIGPVNWITT